MTESYYRGFKIVKYKTDLNTTKYLYEVDGIPFLSLKDAKDYIGRNYLR